jgi:hypothetical protein
MSNSPDTSAIAASWLSNFSQAVSVPADVSAAVDCFILDGWLRDVLVFTWDTRTIHGHDALVNYLSSSLARAKMRDLKLSDEAVLRPALDPRFSAVAAGFTFSTPIATGKGHFALQRAGGADDATEKWKALSVFVMLDDLKGHEENGAEDGVYGGHTISWTDVRQERRTFIESDPYVLIGVYIAAVPDPGSRNFSAVGGGQNGLNVAARFKQMNIPALVIEATERVGDVWRKRYPMMTLHTIKHNHEMLYHPYPNNWPTYTPRDKLADWLEQYAISQDLVVWTNSHPVPTPSFDPATGKWTVVVSRNGSLVTIHPSHIVLATGHNSFVLLLAFY